MPTVRTGDIETHYVSRGSGPPVVFVHGMIMNTATWEPQMEALSDAFTTIAYDVRGHGHTGGSDTSPYSIDLFARDLDAFLSALDVDRAVICGLSVTFSAMKGGACRWTPVLTTLASGRREDAVHVQRPRLQGKVTGCPSSTGRVPVLE